MSEHTERGLLVVLSGPSGVGKTTVADRLRTRSGYRRAVTATTRPPRTGEVDGVHYHFLDETTFRSWIRAGRLLEHAEVHGRHYGTPAAGVEAILDAGEVCLLVIDVQGAAQLRESGMAAYFVFVAPPDDAELERRLRGRGSDPEEEIQRRLRGAREELGRAGEYDTVVLNDDLDRVIDEIEGLVSTRRAGGQG